MSHREGVGLVEDGPRRHQDALNRFLTASGAAFCDVQVFNRLVQEGTALYRTS